MATITQQNQKWLLRKFHSLCYRLKMTADDKLALLSAYGVESSVDLSNEELTQLCDRLNEMVNPEDGKRDRMRKRVIASIGGWLKLIGKENEGIGYIKSVACRAAQVENFNQISLERLTTIYNMFLKKQKDAKAVNEVAGAIAYEARFGKADHNLLNWRYGTDGIEPFRRYELRADSTAGTRGGDRRILRLRDR